MLTDDACSQLIHSLVTVRIDYCNSLLYGMTDSTLFRLQKVLNTAARILKKIPKFSHITDILKDLHWLPIRQRITFKILLLTYQAYRNTAPDYLCEFITPYCSARNLRSNDMLVRPCHPVLEPGIGGKSPPVTEPQFTMGNRFRLWLIIAIRKSPDARNNRHKPNQTVSGAIIITNGL